MDMNTEFAQRGWGISILGDLHAVLNRDWGDLTHC